MSADLGRPIVKLFRAAEEKAERRDSEVTRNRCFGSFIAATAPRGRPACRNRSVPPRRDRGAFVVSHRGHRRRSWSRCDDILENRSTRRPRHPIRIVSCEERLSRARSGRALERYDSSSISAPPRPKLLFPASGGTSARPGLRDLLPSVSPGGHWAPAIFRSRGDRIGRKNTVTITLLLIGGRELPHWDSPERRRPRRLGRHRAHRTGRSGIGRGGDWGVRVARDGVGTARATGVHQQLAAAGGPIGLLRFPPRSWRSRCGRAVRPSNRCLTHPVPSLARARRDRSRDAAARQDALLPFHRVRAVLGVGGLGMDRTREPSSRPRSPCSPWRSSAGSRTASGRTRVTGAGSPRDVRAVRRDPRDACPGAGVSCDLASLIPYDLQYGPQAALITRRSRPSPSFGTSDPRSATSSHLCSLVGRHRSWRGGCSTLWTRALGSAPTLP